MVRKKVVVVAKKVKVHTGYFPYDRWVMTESTNNGAGNTDECTLWKNHIQNVWTHSTNEHANHTNWCLLLCWNRRTRKDGTNTFCPISPLFLVHMGIFPADTATCQLGWTLKPLVYAMCIYPNERTWTGLLKKKILPAVKNTQSSGNGYTFQWKYLTLRCYLWVDFLILCTWSMFNLLGECFPLIHRLFSDI